MVIDQKKFFTVGVFTQVIQLGFFYVGKQRVKSDCTISNINIMQIMIIFIG